MSLGNHTKTIKGEIDKFHKIDGGSPERTLAELIKIRIYLDDQIRRLQSGGKESESEAGNKEEIDKSRSKAW
jgi:hypothetical protein